MIEIKNGKKHFKPPQAGEDIISCNIKILKKKQMGNKIFHPGYCMDVSEETRRAWIDEGVCEEFSIKLLTVKKSTILDSKGQNIEHLIEETQEKPKTK